MPKAKQPILPEASPAASVPPAVDSAELRLLPLDQLDPSAWNRRVEANDPSLAGLAESIGAVGILQPLLVRPLGKRYQILVGTRRHAAARLAGLREVPARVTQGIDDRLAEEITCIENLQRENLHFLDEAACIARLVEGTTQAALAARLGRTARWVARRARLSNLSDAWRAQVRDSQGFAARWTEAHFELVATLEPPAQNALLERLQSYFHLAAMAASELERLIGNETRRVASFPWHATDVTLDPTAGACSACPFRSSQHPTLFATGTSNGQDGRVKPDDRCLDPTCAARKLALHLERQLASLRASHEKVVEVSDSSTAPAPGSVREWSLRSAPRRAAGAVPGLMVTGPHAGVVRWYLDTPEAPRPHGRTASGKRSLAQRRELLDRRRAAHATSTLRAAIHAAAPPELSILVRLAIVFGTSETHRHPEGDAALTATEETAAVEPSTAHSRWAAFEHLAQVEPATTQQRLWERLLPVLLDRTTPHDGLPQQIHPAWREAQRMTALLGLDAQAHMGQATAALPDPKSWAAEERAAARVAAQPPLVPSRDKTKTLPRSTRRPNRSRSRSATPAKPATRLRRQQKGQ